MKASIRVFTTDGISKNGYPVKLILSHKGKVRRKTLSHTFKEEWDFKDNYPNSTHPDYDNLYSIVHYVYGENRRPTIKETESFDAAFKHLLQGEKKKEIDFLEYGERQAEYMEELKRDGNARAYRIALNELKKFHGPVLFEDLTKETLEQFKRYKKTEGVKNSTIKNYLVELRAIYNMAVDEGSIENTKPFSGLFKNLHVPKNTNDKVKFLTRDQIKTLEGLKLDRSHQRAIDLSLLQYYLCGADLIDVYYIKHKDIRNGRVWLKRNKLGEKGYYFDVKLIDKAKSIIDKYKVEGEYVFPWKKEPQAYITFRNNHNRNLKIIQKRLKIELEPRGGYFTSKTMRYTFGTQGKDLYIMEDMLRELMGHERKDIDNNYKAKFKPKERDEVQLRIIG